MEKKTIGSFMAALRKSHGLTQQEVADRLHVSNKTVSKWERDESSPDLGLVPVIAEMYGVTCDEILLGKRLMNKTGETTIQSSVEKQMTRLAEKVTAYFRNIALLTVLISLVGYIALFLCSYAFDLPVPGTGLYAVFLLTGIVVLVTGLNNTLHRLKTGSDTEEKCVADARTGIWLYCFTTVLILLLTLFFALPLLFARDLNFISQPPDFQYELNVISWEIYLRYIPAMKLLWLIFTVPVFILLRRKLQGGRSRMFDTIENGKKLGLIQVALFTCVALLMLITDHVDFMHNHLKFYITEITAVICLILSAVISVIYIALKKDNRLLLTIMAARNLLLWIPLLKIVIFINMTFSYGFSYPALWISSTGGIQTNTFKFNYVVQHVGIHDLGVGSLIYTSLVVFAYAAVKYIYLKHRGKV